MDEPLTHLDADLKQEMLALILSSAAAARASLVYVTHDPAEAEVVSARVGRMEAGRLVFSASGEGGAG
jgi:ABC-type sugar transport system ATPase subunit